MTVAVIAKGLPPSVGGIERYSLEVARAYQQSGEKVLLIAPCNVKPTGVEVISLGGGNALFTAAKLLVVLLFRKGEIDWVHATTWRMALIPFLVRIGRCVLTIHGNEVLRNDRVTAICMKFVVRRAYRVFCVSRFTRRLVLDTVDGLDAANVLVAHNGARDAAERSQHKGPRIRLLSVCRQTTRKNLAAAVAAVIALVREGFDVQYDLIGQGSAHDRLDRQAAAYSERIRLHGHVTESALDRYYADADIFIHPQVSLDGNVEGFGLTVIDSMKAGCAVIAGAAGGPSEFVQSGVEGFLVSGSSREIADRLRSLLESPARLSAMQGAAISKAEGFTWHRHVAVVRASL